MAKKLAKKTGIKYSNALAQRILVHIEQGGNLAQFCRKPKTPDTKTIYEWRKRKSCMVKQAGDEVTFGVAMLVAEELRIASRVEYLLEAMSEDGYEELHSKLGRPPCKDRLRSDESRRRREIDTIKFLAAREIAVKAKRIQVEHSGQVDSGLNVNLINYSNDNENEGDIIDLQPDSLKLPLHEDD